MIEQEELSEFMSIKNELLALLEPMDAERINRVPFPGSWTAGQLGDHLLKSYRVIDLSAIRPTPSQRSGDGKIAQIDAVFLDFTAKYPPPDFLVPSTGGVSGRDLVDELRKSADGIAAFVRERGLSFTCPEFEMLGFGDLTSREWIRLVTVHSKRHVRQLRTILSHLQGNQIIL